jgi:D-beta-D-heptose 7-phosphate kinase/D-beta-D-heptose 1-phosphate adenosyltransferase
VRRAKGEERPINDQNHRALVVAGLEATDAVVIFEEDTPEDLLRLVRPEILVKGAEYSQEQVVGGSIVTSYGGEIVRVQMVEGYSTTKVVEKMRATADTGG